jgi:hypothetical protein
MTVNNRISGSLSSEDIAALTNALVTIREKLPFLHGLTTTERQSLPKLGDKSYAFVTQAVQAATANAKLLPPSFDLAEFQRDYALWQSLQPLLTEFTQLAELIDDTAMALGSDLYTEALAVYSYLQLSGADAGLKDLKASLSQRFKRTSAGPAAATAAATK